MSNLRFPNINSCTISGRLTRDPELKNLQSGTALLKIDIAFNRNYKKDGEWLQETGYVSITAWSDLAEKCNKHLKKGSPVLVEAYLKMESWTNNDNEKRSKLCLVANKIYNLEKDSSNYQEEPDDDEKI